jgi:hypothetical protein
MFSLLIEETTTREKTTMHQSPFSLLLPRFHPLFNHFIISLSPFLP